MKIFLTYLLLAQSIPAALIYSGIQDIPIPTNFNGVSVDLVNLTSVNNGDPDFINTQVNFFFGGEGMISSPLFRPVRMSADQVSPVVALNFGEIVNDSRVVGPPARGGSQNHIGSGATQFTDNEEEYLGFLFDPNDDGEYVAGWMRVTFSQSGSPGTVHDWAYLEIPGESLAVGSVIPEPSAFLFCSLAVLGLCRRRRSSLG